MAGAAPAVTLCTGVWCERGDTRRRTLPGKRLCGSCLNLLGKNLNSMPLLYAGCGENLDGGKSMPQRVSGGPLPGIKFNIAAADCRADIVAVLAAWSDLVAEQRSAAPPRRHVPEMAAMLMRHLDWLAAHPAAAELTEEINKLARAARQVIDPQWCRRIPIGPCVHPGCAGKLVAVIPAGCDILPAEISCAVDPAHSWPSRAWTQLRRRLSSCGTGAEGQHDAGRWLSAAAIASLWGVPLGSVYRLASERGWRRRREAGRTLYLAADVEAAIARQG